MGIKRKATSTLATKSYYNLRSRDKKIRFLEEKQSSSSRPWSDLTEVLLEDIASRLLLKDYCRGFAAVCKSWRSVRHRSDRYASSSSQWLMVLNKKDGACELTDPSCSNKSSYQLKFPELIGSTILYSRDGWLLALVNQQHLFFFDPVTGAKLNLPPPHLCEHCVHDCTATFSASPGSPDCTATIRSRFRRSPQVLVQKWRRGDAEWTGTALNIEFPLDSSISLMSHGPFIWQGPKSKARVLDPSTLQWRFINMSGVTELKRDWRSNDVSALYTTEFDGELFLVCVAAKKCAVGVYKINPSTMKAKRINNLGGLMIFVDKKMALMAPAANPEMANKIFFSSKTAGGALYYSMEAGKYCPPQQLGMGMELLKMAEREFGRNFWWLEGDFLHMWVDSTRFKANGLVN